MDCLDDFYNCLRGGTNVGDFLQRRAIVFQFLRSNSLMRDYHLAKGRLKRFRDEVTPIAVFVRRHAGRTERIQFPLDSGAYDCHWRRAPAVHWTIQVTIAHARARMNVMTELYSKGVGRGFLGLNDDRPTAEFHDAMSNEREMYSTEAAYAAMIRAVELSVNNKTYSQADVLLIDAPLDTLGNRSMEIRPVLARLTERLAFSKVYVVDEGCDAERCIRLK